ncbi:MAG: hypothetical protein CVU61_14430 [Deltaproteobacteria bacterium HGW-Deltaproteobacteria-19]|jgi:hypothetical protein|nr:MAG: hypothetical protein CVU61_14430 [Deltaproteobacteria bacterium HGW-Deltaproteobacteria-19]
MSSKWFYDSKGEPQGPVTEDDLRAILQKLPSGRTTLVWCEGMKQWKRTIDIEQFNSLSVPPPISKVSNETFQQFFSVSMQDNEIRIGTKKSTTPYKPLHKLFIIVIMLTVIAIIFGYCSNTFRQQPLSLPGDPVQEKHYIDQNKWKVVSDSNDINQLAEEACIKTYNPWVTLKVNSCYKFDWQEWVNNRFKIVAGNNEMLINADSDVASPADKIIIYPDGSKRLVFSGCRPHSCPSAMGLFLLDTKKKDMDIIWQADGKIKYLGANAKLLEQNNVINYLISSKEMNREESSQGKDKGSILYQIEQKMSGRADGNYSTTQKENVSRKSESSIAADDLMRNCMIDYEAAYEMGIKGWNAKELKNENQYMKKSISVNGRVSEIQRNRDDGAISCILFDASLPLCDVAKGNVIFVYPQEDYRNVFDNIRLGQSLTVVGMFDNYGRLPVGRTERMKRCGYYIILKESMITN